MSLYDKKKIGHLQKQRGKVKGAGIKLNNYEYGRNKAKKIALAKKMNKGDDERMLSYK